MHIEFSRLILHNFMSFGDADLRFNNDGFIRVSGINENPFDNAGSNGSGKSSLWEALIWVITGDTIRGTSQVNNLYGEDGCYVDIEFYIDSTRYQIIRSKDHKIRKTGIQILINGEDVSGKGIRDSTKLLQQYLPDLTASLLGSVIVLGQGLPQRFTNNSPSGRKEVLERLSKSDFMIEDLKQRVSDRKQCLASTIRNYEDALLSNAVKKQQLESRIKQSEDALSHLDANVLMTTKSLLDEELRKVQEELEHTTCDIDTAKMQQEQATEELILLTSSEAEALQEITVRYNTIIQPAKKYMYQMETEASVIRRQIQDIQSRSDVCPTCGQKLPDFQRVDTTPLQNNLDELKSKMTAKAEKINSMEEEFKHELDSARAKFFNKKQDLQNSKTTAQSIVSNNSTRKQELSQKQDKLTKELNNILVDLAQITSLIETNKNIIQDSFQELHVIEEDNLYNNMQKDLTQSHLEVINKFDTALKRDFRGYLLSTVINQIETRAKYYSNIIFDTDKVNFCLNGNNIDISYMDRAYENLSGGEKQKVDLIIQFSIRDMLSQQLGFTSNILVLDEVFDGLDATGCNKVIDMIASLSDVKNVFIVTHRKDLSIPSDQEVIVVKSSLGLSEIRR